MSIDMDTPREIRIHPSVHRPAPDSGRGPGDGYFTRFGFGDSGFRSGDVVEHHARDRALARAGSLFWLAWERKTL